MSDTEPVFVIKLTGILSPKDIERYERGFQEQLPGRVIVVDGRVEDVREVAGMQPRNAVVTVHHKRREFDRVDPVDGNTAYFRTADECEKVPAKVWPVAMSSDELLVEWEDGTLGAVKLRDIRMAK